MKDGFDLREEILHDLYYDLGRAAFEMQGISLRQDDKDFYGLVGNLFERALKNHGRTPPAGKGRAGEEDAMKVPELLPCPFCGDGAIVESGMGEYWVRCCGPYCRGSGPMRSTENIAVMRWNRRTPPADKGRREGRG